MSLARRHFIQAVGALGLASAAPWRIGIANQPVVPLMPLAAPNEGLEQYLQRIHGQWHEPTYFKVLGAANDFKEGDAIVGVAAETAEERTIARTLLKNTPIKVIDQHPVRRDSLFNYIESARDSAKLGSVTSMTMGQLVTWLLESDEATIKSAMGGLSSDVIACVVKLMNNDQLIAVSSKLFNPLPGSHIGARGYLGARVQPNSPTDHPDDIRWQVFDAFAYAVGDVVLGTNPVSSNPESVHAVEQTLQEILQVFALDTVMPHCVLAHVDVQREVEQRWPGSTALWFQSIAGSDTANQTFDVTVGKLQAAAKAQTGRYGLYFETGQGADFTNGHGHGYDMVIHEARKYGFARALTQEIAKAKGDDAVWLHVNDVAGFIGPEVFRTREQLVRCCLEDLVMGKLHGLTIGLDVCATLHMDISPRDLDWCLEQIAPAAPAYLMALPTKIDPMLGYLTTGYHDHARLRERFGCRVNDPMQAFFQKIGVLDAMGRPTEKYGDPSWVYLKYCRARGDQRADDVIWHEAAEQIAAVRRRGVFIAEGSGAAPGDLPRELQQQIDAIYTDAKQSIWREWDEVFVASIPSVQCLQTQSKDREDYILHPSSGELLSVDSVRAIELMRNRHAGKYDAQIVISEGLNALALMDAGNLDPLLVAVREQLTQSGLRLAPEHLVVTSGRVRAGYRVGEMLFGGLPGAQTLVHIIGERPGSGHHTMSVYLTHANGNDWAVAGRIDHDRTKVVSGISTTALSPGQAAIEVGRIVRTMR